MQLQIKDNKVLKGIEVHFKSGRPAKQFIQWLNKNKFIFHKRDKFYFKRVSRAEYTQLVKALRAEAWKKIPVRRKRKVLRSKSSISITNSAYLSECDRLTKDIYEHCETKDQIYARVSTDVLNEVNKRILAHLKKGELPWVKSYADGVPVATNYFTKKRYRGINAMLFLKPGYYLSRSQIKRLGGKLSKMANPHLVYYATTTPEYTRLIDPKKPAKGKEIIEKEYTGLVERIYLIYHISDIEGIDFKLPKQVINTKIERSEVAEQIIKGYPKAPTIKHGFNIPFYRPSQDLVGMPFKKGFISSEEYYSTLFHELIHSTGAKKRLSRLSNDQFGDEQYSFEELIAEAGAAQLSNLAGFSFAYEKNAAAYIKGWLKVYQKTQKDDPRAILRAFAQAQKAVEYILNGKTYKPKPKTKPAATRKKKKLY